MDYLDLVATSFNHFSEQNAERKQLFGTSAALDPAAPDGSATCAHSIRVVVCGPATLRLMPTPQLLRCRHRS
jgi:hypothetical protein